MCMTSAHGTFSTVSADCSRLTTAIVSPVRVCRNRRILDGPSNSRRPEFALNDPCRTMNLSCRPPARLTSNRLSAPASDVPEHSEDAKKNPGRPPGVYTTQIVLSLPRSQGRGDDGRQEGTRTRATRSRTSSSWRAGPCGTCRVCRRPPACSSPSCPAPRVCATSQALPPRP